MENILNILPSVLSEMLRESRHDFLVVHESNVNSICDEIIELLQRQLCKDNIEGNKEDNK